MTSYTFSIDFPRWKVLSYDSFRSKVVLLAKRNMLRDLRDQSERFKWSREQAQNLSLHIFSHNYHNYSMFRDVPECSGMFQVPGFIDGSWKIPRQGFGIFDNQIKPQCWYVISFGQSGIFPKIATQFDHALKLD